MWFPHSWQVSNEENQLLLFNIEFSPMQNSHSSIINSTYLAYLKLYIYNVYNVVKSVIFIDNINGVSYPSQRTTFTQLLPLFS